MATNSCLGLSLVIVLASNATLLSVLLMEINIYPNRKAQVSEFGTPTQDSDDSPVTAVGDRDEQKNAKHGPGRRVPEGLNGLADSDPGTQESAATKHLWNFMASSLNVEQNKSGKSKFRRSVRLGRLDTGHYLNDVIATLTESELSKLEPSVVKILLPALRGLESIVLRELERLHDVSVNQELRLEKLENSHYQQAEVLAAAELVSKELQQHTQQGFKWTSRVDVAPSQTTTPEKKPLPPPAGELADLSVEVTDFDNRSSLLLDNATGSGDDAMVRGTEAPTPAKITTTEAQVSTNGVNQVPSADSAYMAYLSEIYSSLSAMEQKVVDLGSSLTAVSSEMYRQRSTFVRMEDKVEEMRRTQRNLVMKSTVHTFKLADLEQFKGHMELQLRTLEGMAERFESRLEVFKDRMTEQGDDMQAMRGIFSRLEQAANEMRASDSFKAHDIQELKRTSMQIEARLTGLYHNLDRYVGNMRMDVKTYVDNLYKNNQQQG